MQVIKGLAMMLFFIPVAMIFGGMVTAALFHNATIGCWLVLILLVVAFIYLVQSRINAARLTAQANASLAQIQRIQAQEAARKKPENPKRRPARNTQDFDKLPEVDLDN